MRGNSKYQLQFKNNNKKKTNILRTDATCARMRLFAVSGYESGEVIKDACLSAHFNGLKLLNSQ